MSTLFILLFFSFSKEPFDPSRVSIRETLGQILCETLQSRGVAQNELQHHGERHQSICGGQQGPRGSLRGGLLCWADGEELLSPTMTGLSQSACSLPRTFLVKWNKVKIKIRKCLWEKRLAAKRYWVTWQERRGGLLTYCPLEIVERSYGASWLEPGQTGRLSYLWLLLWAVTQSLQNYQPPPNLFHSLPR